VPVCMCVCVHVCVCSPQLTWRDMQHIVVITAQMVNLHADDWVVNGIGRKGMNLMDAVHCICILYTRNHTEFHTSVN